MSGNCLIGIDLGTSSLKAILLEAGGRRLGLAAVEYPVDTPYPGWAEQDPETWYQAALTAVHQVMAASGLPPRQVAGIGLAGQMHGLVCLDRRGANLRPAIIWADQRSETQVEAVKEAIGLEKLARWTGNPLAAGFMLPSWLWLRANEPALASRTASLLLPKDYLRFRLTGVLGSEPSDASSTSLFDPAARAWSRDLLTALTIDPALLPPLSESTSVAGGLLPAAAAATGLLPGTPVVFGGSDQSCQAVGHGVIDPGLISCTIGTGGQLLAPTLRPAVDPQLRLHLFCHALPDRWHLEAAILSAGLAFKWLRDQVLSGYDYAGLADLAAAIPPGADGLYFLPHLVGERTPYMDPQARGSFIGLTLRHSRAHLARAVMEGVVFALRQGLELMLSLGVPAERIIASGGATAHPLWLQLQADIFNRPLFCTPVREAAAVGAARLAGVGAGLYPDVNSACAAGAAGAASDTADQPTVIQPDPTAAACYAAAYQVYSGLYPALKPVYRS